MWELTVLCLTAAVCATIVADWWCRRRPTATPPARPPAPHPLPIPREHNGVCNLSRGIPSAFRMAAVFNLPTVLAYSTVTARVVSEEDVEIRVRGVLRRPVTFTYPDDTVVMGVAGNEADVVYRVHLSPVPGGMRELTDEVMARFGPWPNMET